MRPHEVTSDEKNVIIRLLTDYLTRKDEIIVAYLHGSFLSGTFRDIDIGLILHPDFIPPRYYEQSIEREIEWIVSLPIDIRILSSAPHRFAYSVMRTREILISKDESLRSSFESEILSQVLDYQYYFDRHRGEVLGLI